MLSVVKNKMDYEAPIVGVISNSFDDISSFVELEEDNVALKPIFNDVLGERARATVTTVKTAVDEFEGSLNQFFSKPKYPLQIPAVELFGLEECNQEANKVARQIELPQSLKDTVSVSTPRGRNDPRLKNLCHLGRSRHRLESRSWQGNAMALREYGRVYGGNCGGQRGSQCSASKSGRRI